MESPKLRKIKINGFIFYILIYETYESLIKGVYCTIVWENGFMPKNKQLAITKEYTKEKGWEKSLIKLLYLPKH